jgi:hypothetical protein
MNNYIYCVKGISGSGKSTRVYLLLKFFRDIMEYEIEDFFILNTKGKLVSIGYLVKDLNLIFIGKEYQSGQFKRFQGIDSQTGVFGSNESISNFIKDCSDKYSIILEGAGTT